MSRPSFIRPFQPATAGPHWLATLQVIGVPTAGAWRGGSDPRAARPDRPDEPPDLSGREPPLRRVGTPREASSSPFQGQRLQRLADGLTAAKVDALLRKWLARLPHPFNRPDRQQGIRYDISILQADFALTQVFDRPAQGRVFFEEVVRENLDMGRPDHVQLIFDRRVSPTHPLAVSHPRHQRRGHPVAARRLQALARIKQYHKEGRALRTETVINDTYDFDVRPPAEEPR